MAGTLGEFYGDLFGNQDNQSRFREDPRAYLDDSGLPSDLLDIIESNDASRIKDQIASELDTDADSLIGIILLWFTPPV